MVVDKAQIHNQLNAFMHRILSLRNYADYAAKPLNEKIDIALAYALLIDDVDFARWCNRVVKELSKGN